MDYVLSLIIVCAVSFALAAYAWTRPPQPTTRAYAAVAFTQGLWTLCYALDPVTPPLPQKLVLDHLAWLFGYIFGLSLLRLVLIYTGRRWSRRTWALVALPALLFTLAAFTNESLHLMYSWTGVAEAPPYVYMDFTYTPVSWGAYLYSYVIMLIIFWLLLRHLMDTSAPFRIHTAIMCAGVAIPSLFTIASVFVVLTTGSPVTSNVVGAIYALGTVLIAVGVFRARLFRTIPIAHEFVFDHMSDAVLVVDTEHRIAEFNPAMRAFAAPNVTTLTGKTLEQAFPRLTDEFKGFADSGDVDRVFVSDVSGHKRHYDLKIRSIEDRRGSHLGRLGVIRDITEQVRLEELKVSEETLKVALQKERELNTLKTKMMIRIAHEFRTPLSVIALTGETLDKYFDKLTDERRREKIDEILQRIQHLAQILDDITTVVQGEYSEQDSASSVFRIAALCQECADTLNARKDNHCAICISPPLPEASIKADRRGVRAILTELLTNAVKYSPQATPIQLTCKFEAEDLILQVSDQGIGVPEEDQPRIFEPFFRGRNSDDVNGLGLGLSIVQNYVLRYGGDISVAGRSGGGTTFTLRLPGVAYHDPVDSEHQPILDSPND